MLDSLLHLIQHYSLRLIQLPLALWTNYRWAVLRFQETTHLLRLDDYLLKDMGLRKVGNRIEAIDVARIDPRRDIFNSTKSNPGCCKRYRHAN